MRVLLPLILFALLPSAALGFDPRGVDIIAFRLGMTEAEVMGQIDRQGYRDEAFRRLDTPCPGASQARCISVIEARTRDGALRLQFAPAKSEPTVERISYTFDARRPNEPEALERAVLDRYGPPTTSGPMTWCDRRAGTGPCPANAPRLVFEPGVGSSRILTLSLH